MRRFLKLKALGLLTLIVVATLCVLPSVIPEEQLPGWLSDTFSRQFKLGLDLQGGLHLEYSVAVDEALERKLDALSTELEAAFDDKKGIRPSIDRVGADTLYIKFEELDQLKLATDDVLGVAKGMLERVDNDEDGLRESDGVITLRMPKEVMTKNRSEVVGNALETVRKRVDAMGVAEPNIYPKNRQIVVELPGLSDTQTEAKAAVQVARENLRDIIKRDGAVQVVLADVEGDPWAFKITVPEADIDATMKRVFAGKIVEDRLIFDKRLDGYELEMRHTAADIAADPATMVLALSAAAQEKVLEESSDFRRLLKIIERQAVLTMHLVDDWSLFRDTGKPYLEALYEGGLVTKGMGISVNEEAGYGNDGNRVEQFYSFYAKDVGTLRDFFNNLPPQWRLEPDWMVAFGPEKVQVRTGTGPDAFEVLYKTWVLKSRAGITGDKIISADVSFDSQSGQPQVNVTLNRLGATLMEELSGANVGRKMAIVLDDQVRSDPVFQDRLGANFRITLGATGNKSVNEEANDLVKVLKSGSLPARLNKEFEIRVGAELGRDSVVSGFTAMVIGLAAVILFMLVYYRGSGFVAVLALLMNMVFILAAMAFFEATLTLPGIAGIVLTIGMAVDANVIVFERIREYVREGFTARTAIDSGYDRAFTTILDAQLTTAIAGLVLYQYGSGPIQGFAVTLMIGIATSIFTGVWGSRIFFDFQANRRGFDRVSI